MSLEDIREKKTSVWVYIIIGLLLVGMAGFGTSQFGTGGNPSTEAVMTAGNAEVSAMEYDNALRNIQQRNPDLDATAAKQIALDSLKQRLALTDYISRHPLAASNKMIDEVIQNDPSFFNGGKFSEETFRRLVRTSPEVYRRSVSKNLAMQQLQSAISNSAVVSAAETAPYEALQNLSRDILVAKIARDSFTNTAEDTEIKAFYDANKSKYMTEEQVDIEYIDYNPADIAKTEVVTDEEITQSTMPPRRASYYVFADKVAAQTAYDKLQAGDSLEAVKAAAGDALEDSGDIGQITPVIAADALVPQSAADAIYGLSEVGQFTAPLDIDGTAYLFELTDKGNALVLDEAATAAAKLKLQTQKAADKIAKLGEKLNQAVFDTATPSLDNIAEATGLSAMKSGLQGIQSGQGILAVPALREAFATADRAVGKLQEPVTIGDRVIIYRFSAVKPPEQKTLETVKSAVEQAVINEKTDKQLAEATQQLLEKAQAGRLTAAATAANYPVQTFTDFKGSVSDNNVLDPIGAMLIQQQPPLLGDKNAAEIQSPTGDAYVYVTTDVRLGDSKNAENGDNAKRMAEMLANQMGSTELRAFLESVTERADIRVRTSLLNEATN